MIAALAALVSCGSQTSADYTLVVGSFTNSGSEGIYTYALNTSDGSCRPLAVAKAKNPSFLVLSEDGSKVYAVNENRGCEAGLETFAFDASAGTLEPLGFSATGSDGPTHVSASKELALASNYSGGSLCVFPIGKEGVIAECSQVFPGTASGPFMDNQAAPHVHCAMFTPDGKHVVATDFSADRLMHFDIAEDATLVPSQTPYTEVAPGTGPRHITFSPAGSHAYVIGELSGEITSFKLDGGAFETIQTVPADSLGGHGSADIHLSPDGRFLYSSNRLVADGIAIFAVDPSDGTLTQVGYQLTGPHPRNFNITPDGRFLLCACRDSDAVEMYSRNAETGLLSLVGTIASLPHPTCVLIVPTKK